MKHLFRLFFITAVVLLTTNSVSFAQSRSKVISFDDELVEGVNRQPYDSVSQVSEKNKKKKKHHLYQKRGAFHSEVEVSLQAVPIQ